jgi:hypothetical protein
MSTVEKVQFSTLISLGIHLRIVPSAAVRATIPAADFRLHRDANCLPLCSCAAAMLQSVAKVLITQD